MTQRKVMLMLVYQQAQLLQIYLKTGYARYVAQKKTVLNQRSEVGRWGM
jgi:phosphoribosyl-AMP cyclohydrolase